MGDSWHNRVGGGRAKYFPCERSVIVNEEPTAVDDFRRENAIHYVSDGKAEDVRSHGLPLVEAVSLKYRAVLLPYLDVSDVEGSVEEEEISQGGEVEGMTRLSVTAAENHVGGEASEGSVCILAIDSDDCVSRRLEIHSEKHVPRGSFRARSYQTVLKLLTIYLPVVHCVANGEEARDEATEGGAEQEWAGTSYFCVVGWVGMLRV